MEDSVEGFLKTASQVEVDLIEVRADGLLECTPENVHSILTDLKKTTQARIILTVRKKDEGGRFEGTEEERKNVLLGSLHLADIIDIEFNCAIRDEVVSKARANRVEVIVSYHDFEKTPSTKEMKDIIVKETKAGANYAKVAFKANTLHDVLELLWVTEKMRDKTRVIAISMGDIGMISRIGAPIFGSAITYASTDAKTAPGQLSVEDTKSMFEMLGVSR
jgi:3-dehydroquinate dehydratase-1